MMQQGFHARCSVLGRGGRAGGDAAAAGLEVLVMQQGFHASAGFWGAAGALVAMPLARGVAAGVCATSAVLGAAGLARGGFSVNHMDIAPRHAGVVMGVSNTAGTLAGAPGQAPQLLCGAVHSGRGY